MCSNWIKFYFLFNNHHYFLYSCFVFLLCLFLAHIELFSFSTFSFYFLLCSFLWQFLLPFLSCWPLFYWTWLSCSTAPVDTVFFLSISATGIVMLVSFSFMSSFSSSALCTPGVICVELGFPVYQKKASTQKWMAPASQFDSFFSTIFLKIFTSTGSQSLYKCTTCTHILKKSFLPNNKIDNRKRK